VLAIFITFEGGEGAGKTTQIQLLLKHLTARGLDVVSLRDPGATPISEKIRGILKDPAHANMTPRTEALLYLAARTQMVEELIVPALDEEKIVICDRFTDSTVVYQGHAGSLGMTALQGLCDFSASGLVPDLTLFLHIHPEDGLSRKTEQGELDRLEMKGLNFHKQVLAGFEYEAEKNPGRIVTIDATQSVEKIHSIIIEHVDKIFNK